MKTYLILIAGFAIAYTASAQAVETVFGKGGPKVRGAYGVAAQKFSSIDGQFANFLGGFGGVMFENGGMIGAGAFTLLNGQSIDIENDADTYRNLTYTGLIVERTFQSAKAIHFTANVLMGAAFIGEQNRLQGGGTYFISSRGAFVTEPTLNVEVNLTRWFRAGAGVGYRWVADKGSYSAPSATLSLKFGKF
jgi:hypothetical protein